jgi:GntR family transcriptional regulator
MIPVYYQIKETIKNWILNRDYKMGEKIPSENELAAHFKVNRLTVRQATSKLAQEGFLVSRRGEGTFVTIDKGLIDSLSFEFSGFLDSFFRQVSKSKNETVGRGEELTSESLRDKLGLKGKEQPVVRINRLQSFQGRPFAYHVNYVPREFGQQVLSRDLSKKSILQVFEQDLHIELSEGVQTVLASFANQEVAGYLNISAGSPVLFVESILYGKRRKPIYLVQSSYRGDLFRYIVRLKRFKKKNGDSWQLIDWQGWNDRDLNSRRRSVAIGGERERPSEKNRNRGNGKVSKQEI